MSRVYADNVYPELVTEDLTLGASGDSVVVTSGASLNVNTLKDSGGNTLFTSNGSGVLSSVNSAFQGKPTLIATNTETNATSSSFTSSIDSTYKLYIFKFYDINPATDNVHFQFQFSSNGGSSYGMTVTSSFFRAYHNEDNSAAALGYQGTYDLAQSTDYQSVMYGMGNGADEAGAGELHFFNPSSTTYVKQFYCITNSQENSDYSLNTYCGGYINSTSAVNAIDFKMSSGNFDGTIKMYGL